MQRRSNYSRGPKPPLHRINNNIIDVDKVRLISSDGGASIVSFKDALIRAKSQNLDLVEIASDKGFPICKIIDYGKFKFELLKKEKDNKKKQHVVALKEIKLGVRIDNNDFSNKQKQAQSFLEKGDKVKVSLRFRGREIMHANLGLEVVQKMIDGLSDLGTAEKKPELEGRQIVVIIAPKKNKTKVENTDAKDKDS